MALGLIGAFVLIFCVPTADILPQVPARPQLIYDLRKLYAPACIFVYSRLQFSPMMTTTRLTKRAVAKLKMIAAYEMADMPDAINIVLDDALKARGIPIPPAMANDDDLDESDEPASAATS